MANWQMLYLLFITCINTHQKAINFINDFVPLTILSIDMTADKLQT